MASFSNENKRGYPCYELALYLLIDGAIEEADIWTFNKLNEAVEAAKKEFNTNTGFDAKTMLAIRINHTHPNGLFLYKNGRKYVLELSFDKHYMSELDEDDDSQITYFHPFTGKAFIEFNMECNKVRQGRKHRQ